MAAKYHISENGMPGKCTAANPESCPKTQAGDSFHGTLEEATHEAQKRFEAELGAFTTSSRAAEAKEAADSLRANGEEIYRHPQGKIIKIDASGNVKAFKDGRQVSTSATAEKLRAGYGAWKRDDTSATEPSDSVDPTATVPSLSFTELQDSYARKLIEVQDSQADSRDLYQEHRDYDAKHGAIEGRAYYFGRRADGSYGNIDGVNPNGSTSFRPSPEQRAEREAMNERVKDAIAAEEAAQTAIEAAGFGHRIPDQGNTIRVRTQAQKWLLKDELQGQISDGKWENTAGNPWQDWSNAKVIVDPNNPGRNFNTTKDNYQLNSRSLLDVVGDRMQKNVQDRTGDTRYDERAMQDDLKDLRTIFKTKRGQVTGD